MEDVKEENISQTSLESLRIPKSDILAIFGKCKLSIERGDILAFSADAIVTVTSTELVANVIEEEDTIGTGISGEINKACGPKLREECLDMKEVAPNVRCPIGEARMTGAYELKTAKHIIHTVGPKNTRLNKGKAKELLANCYKSCIDLASKHELYRIAFPLICVGLTGFPVNEAVTIALDSISVVADKLDYPQEVWFVMKQKHHFGAFRTQAEKRFKPQLRKKSNPFVEKGSTFRMLPHQKVLSGMKNTVKKQSFEAFAEEEEEISESDSDSDSVLEQKNGVSY
jgi:O-acetyl-ADP-ribose deacetylase (regulator of RNase III)